MVKRRVLYFGIGTFGETPYVTGGTIYAKNLVQRLVEDDDIELFALNVNREKNRQGTEEFFKRRGVDLHYVVRNAINRRPERADFSGAIEFLSKILFRFPYEMEARNQPHIAKAANWAIRHWQIEHLLVGYVPAAVFWKDVACPFRRRSSPSTVRPICTLKSLRLATARMGHWPGASATGV